jgi:hypothetical protein
VGQHPVGDEILINILGLKLKPVLKKNGLFVFYGFALSAALPKIIFTPCAMRHACLP